ncbi:MAG: glycoside hydrolase family 3 C-terminal domain-containing protein [Bacteroidales bacterium]|nr:glycoside hydrolase family 3 C-terminal domain-containing protein [Bacteroidales bacterium]
MRFRYNALLLSCLLIIGCKEKNSIEYRIDETLRQLTLDEKIALIHAQSKFSSKGVPRLGIPELWCDDGPHGVRPETLWDEWDTASWTNDSCTAFPSLTCLAASWDRSLAEEYGKNLGEEARYRGKNVLLGPGVNICRTPLCGRNFEYMGEDPYLSGQMSVPYIKGLQSNKVAACVKHYALNNQEYERLQVNVNVDERTLQEIYLPAFRMAVQDGGAWSLMSSYNKFQNEWVSHNSYLLKDILKDGWNWDGAVISDWGAVHDTDGAANGGLDLEFGSHTNGVDQNVANAYDSYYMAQPYKEKLKEGTLSESELDDKVRRVLRLHFRTASDGYFGKMCTDEHYEVCRKIGAEGIVLLKNAGILPMKKEARKIVVLGENAIRPMVVGGSSSSLKAQHEISPLEGIRRAYPDAEVVYERAYYSGEPTPGKYNYSQYDITETRSAEKLIEDALAAVENADYVIFIGGLNKNKKQDCEGKDRLSYDLPYNQNEVIENIAERCPDLIYVNISGSPVAMPFRDKVGAILQGWYLGSETGNAIADVLTGKVNPSGKLPFTFPSKLEDGPIRTERQYPGVTDGQGRLQVYYDEGLYVGYRWYDKHNITTLFPFGYGMSYTTFEYGEAKASSHTMKDRLTISIPVKNTGKSAGAEVVQLYIHDQESTVDRPEKELKGFEKIWLEPGETKTVTFTIGKDALSFYDVEKHGWVAEKGAFTALVGASSTDIRSSITFDLK